MSPHLDDGVFSCGGTMAVLADAGWRVVLATAFTRSVAAPQGFALACQRDKGLADDVDYMALRRAEDLVAAEVLGVDVVRWLDLEEAPHRGYESAAALFGPMVPGDNVWRPLAKMVQALEEEFSPDLVLGPQGLGNHVDHRQMIRAIDEAGLHCSLAFYRDTPYAIRNVGALPFVTRAGLEICLVPVGPGLDRKVAAACAYGSQVGFQFGGTLQAGTALRDFAAAEGDGAAAERFLGLVPVAATS